MNGGPTATNLATWLATNFPYLYGANAGANNLTGKTNTDVAALFMTFFNGTAPKTDAQVMAGALAMYVSDSDLAGSTAAGQGFNISTAGTGAKVYNVGTYGSALGLVNNTSYPVSTLLQQANLRKQAGTFDVNAFNAIFDGINTAGDRGTCHPDTAQLSVVKTPDNGAFTQGAQVAFTIVVTNPANAGGTSATNATLTDSLPTARGLTWTTATTTQGTCTISGGSALSCAFGTIASQASVTVTVKSPATTPVAACQTQVNVAANATADGYLMASDSGSMTCVKPAPAQLSVVKTPDGGSFAQGGQASFTIKVSNPAAAGASSATNVTLTDALPTAGGMSWTAATATQGTCTITGGSALSCSLGTIAPQATVTVVVTSPATTPAAACQLQNNPAATATADGGLTGTDSGSLTCTPAARPNVRIVKTGNGPVHAGDVATFTIVATNDGPGSATGVTITDTLPASLTWTDNQTACTISTGGVMTCNVGTLAQGATFTVAVSAPVTPTALTCLCFTPTHHDGDHCDHEQGKNGHYDGDGCEHEGTTNHHHSGDGCDHEKRQNGHYAGDGCDHEKENHAPRHHAGDNDDHEKSLNGHHSGDNCSHEQDLKRHRDGDGCDHDKGTNGHHDGDGCQHEKDAHRHYGGDGDDHEKGRFGHHSGDGCDHEKDTTPATADCNVRNTATVVASNEDPALVADNSSTARIGLAPTHHEGDHCDHEKGDHGHHDGDGCEHEQTTHHHYSGDGDDHEKLRNGHYNGDGCDHERQKHSERHGIGDGCDHEKGINGHHRGDNCSHEQDLKKHHEGDDCDHDRGVNGHHDGDGCSHEKDMHRHYTGDGDDHEKGRFGHHDGDGCSHDQDNHHLYDGCACATAPAHQDGDRCDHEQGRNGHHDGDHCDHEKATGHHYRGDNDDHERGANGHYSGDGCDHEHQMHATRHFDGDGCSHEDGAWGHHDGDGCQHEQDLNKHHSGDGCDHDRGVNGHHDGDGCAHERDSEHHYKGDGDDHERGRFGHHDNDGDQHDRDQHPTSMCTTGSGGTGQHLVSASSAGADDGVLKLTIPQPASTVAGNVMMAVIAVRPSTATITAPAGWTLVRRLNNVSGNSSSLATYWKVAGSSEPATYNWTFSSSNGSAGGILSFSGVNTTTPVDVQNGVNTASSLSHSAPSITTTAANEILVTAYAFASTATWTPASGMTEAVDDNAWVSGTGSTGISIAIDYTLRATAGATGTRTATASNDADTGNAQAIALKSN